MKVFLERFGCICIACFGLFNISAWTRLKKKGILSFFMGLVCEGDTTSSLFELFFCKKIPSSRRVEYVMDGSMDQSVSE